MKRSTLHPFLKAIAHILRRPLRLLLCLFYDKKYLQGRHFEHGFGGFVWAFSAIWQRNFLRLGPPLPFPASSRSTISNGKNVYFHPNDLNNFQSPGIYLQNFKGIIIIGKGSYIGPNVGIITANHNPLDLDKHLQAKNVEIGEDCWIGMNSIILPGVSLGPRCIVAAGSIVTRSFPNGNCIIAGNPAETIKKLPHTHESPLN
jgi:hypothetical protein